MIIETRPPGRNAVEGKESEESKESKECQSGFPSGFTKEFKNPGIQEFK